ncbi:MAG: Protein of unknown function (DUF-B2219) [Candidatus Nitrotoga sp. SPKER]|nr:MAG: Protein of unknown function (DUF-B2219) [Candidatus Nitrotoga sp. SPKER]
MNNLKTIRVFASTSSKWLLFFFALILILFSNKFSNAQNQDLTTDKIPPRMPLHEFVKDEELMKALIKGVRAMKERKPSDPLSWFYQAAIHGVTPEKIAEAAAQDPDVLNVDQKKYWNQCPHNSQESANFLPWHRAYTSHFERILRAHTDEPRFSLPYWDYSKPENYRFPREFGITKLSPKLAATVGHNYDNPLWYEDRNLYFASWEHWSNNYLPYVQLTPEAVDWSLAKDSLVFFGATEQEGLGGGVADDDTNTRGLLESFPHDPLHRITGIVVPDQIVFDPSSPGKVITKAGDGLGMAKPATAGFDPIFSIHHSNIDRLWAEWSLMPDKGWGHFPPQEWFDEKPWFFFDPTVVFDPISNTGQLQAKPINRARKEYFDHRALGISFKYENLNIRPLALPDQILLTAHKPITDLKKPLSLASFTVNVRVSGLRPERVSTSSISQSLKVPAEKTRDQILFGASSKRILMRIHGIDLSAIQSTGFDVHIVTDSTKIPKRIDKSFVGTIALFRHSQKNQSPLKEHGNHNDLKSTDSHDTFDITQALKAIDLSDLSKVNVVIVPYSLSARVDDGTKIAETSSLSFDRIEFLSE